MLQTFTLKNGVQVATYSIPQMRSIFISTKVKGGSIFDTETSSGTAHFMEHILVQGTPSFPTVEELSDYMESLAGSYGASTGSLSIRFTASAPSKHAADLLKIASEIFYSPLFAKESIERERGAILSEIKERKDALWYKNSQFWNKLRYRKNHPLLLDPGGLEEVVSKIKRADLKKFWAKLFLPGNTYLVLVGGFENPQIKKLINQYFGQYQNNSKFSGFPKLTKKDMSDKTVGIRTDLELKTCYVDLTFPSNSMEAPIEEAANQFVLKSILGRMRGSRLYRLLRQRRGLVYDVGFGSSAYPLFGYCYAYCQVSPEKLDEVLELLIKEISVFYQNGPTETEVEFAKNYHINRVLMQFDHPAAIADWIEDDLMWEDKIYTPEEYAEIISKVSVEKIKQFMQKYWDFTKLNLTIQGPVEGTRENKKRYLQLLGDIG